MFRVPSMVLLGMVLALLSSNKTMAQRVEETGVVYEAGRNKIGLILHCRNKALLDPAVADEAVTAVELGLSKLRGIDPLTREQGERAQQAGEDGYWETGRRRDIASVAKLFRTTPSDLCREWAGETLRARHREITTLAVVAPLQAVQQAEPTAVERVEVAAPPDCDTSTEWIASSDPTPPLPEKTPFPATEPELASLPRTSPTGGRLASSSGAVSGHVNAATAATTSATSQSLGRVVPLSARLSAEATGSLPREQTVTAALPSRRPDDPSRPLADEWPFSCFMPGCKWPTSQDRAPPRY